MTEELYCAQKDCLKRATHEVEGTSYCCEHLAIAFKGTTLDITILV